MPSRRTRLTQLRSPLQVQPGRLAVMVPGSWRADKQGSTARLYTYRWQQARAAFLREHPLCVMCLDEVPSVVTAATVCDHSIAHRGDEAIFWDRSRWQSLCERHHNSEAQRRDNALK